MRRKRRLHHKISEGHFAASNFDTSRPKCEKMCLRLVASLAALAVAQQERVLAGSSMNLDAYKKAKDEAAMLRLLLGTQTRATRPITHSSWTSRRSSGTAMFSITRSRAAVTRTESGSGPAPRVPDVGSFLER